MKTSYFLHLIGIIILISCNNPKPSKTIDNKTQKTIEPPYNIDLLKNMDNLRSVPISSVGKGLEYIPLETTNNNLLKRIHKFELGADYIFVSDFNKLLQFDRNGKFIRQVGSNGRGPGEYISANDFCIDEERKKVYVLAWGINAILEYDFAGRFISKSATLPFNSFQFLANDSSGFVFHVSDSPDGSVASKNNLYITDFKCNILFNVKRYFIRNSNYQVGRTSMYFINGTLRFEQFGVDTLYTVKNEKLKPYAIFNLGQLKMDPNILFTRPGSLEEVSKKLNEKLCIRNVLEDGNFIFTRLCFGISDSSKYFVFNKKTTETTLLENDGFTNDIDGGMPFWPKYIYNDSILIDYYDAYSFLNKVGKVDSEQLKEKFGDKYKQLEKQASKLDKLDNPILIILHQ